MRKSTSVTKRRMPPMALRVRRLREAKGWTTRTLDRRAGLSAGYTWLLESGKRQRPELETISKLALALGVSLDWLATGAQAAA